MTDRTPPVQFRPGDLASALDARTDAGLNRNEVARRDLARYYAALAFELRGIVLSEAEAALVCDACNGVLHDEQTAGWIAEGVADAIVLDGLADKWGIDGDDLIARLRSLRHTQRLAIVDAVERYWVLTERGETMADDLRAVGLIRAPQTA